MKLEEVFNPTKKIAIKRNFRIAKKKTTGPNAGAYAKCGIIKLRLKKLVPLFPEMESEISQSRMT